MFMSDQTNPGNVHELSDDQFTKTNAEAGEVKTVTDARQNVPPPPPVGKFKGSPKDLEAIRKGAQEMLVPKKPGKYNPSAY